MSYDTAHLDIAKIRMLLTEAFTAEELRRFCLDHPVVQPVVAEFGPGLGLDDMVDKVIAYCRNRLLFPELLAGVKQENPRQYARFEPVLGIPQAPPPGSSRAIMPDTWTSEPIAGKGESGGVRIAPAFGRDKTVQGDEITITGVGAGAAVAAGRGASASVSQSTDLIATLNHWRSEMEAKIEGLPDLPLEEKQDAKEQVAKIEQEVAKGERASPTRLEKLISTLGVVAPDILEVAITTLANPLAGIGLVLKKIGDKVRVERQATSGVLPS